MKVMLVILGIVLVVAIVVVAGCRMLTSRSTEATVALTAKLPGKVAVVYYSQSKVGNTATVAKWIAKHTGGELVPIETIEAYPDAYGDTLKAAKKDMDSGGTRAIKSVHPLDGYDVVFIGSPIWYGTYAPPVAEFFKSHSFAGKTVVPFCTHGGGGAGRYFVDVRKACPDATVKDGLVYTDESEDVGSSVSAVNGMRLYLDAADKSDRNMEFAYWSCSPSTVELCDGFDLRSPYLECIMPEANVSFTANYVSKPGYVCVWAYEINSTANADEEPEGIEWSSDGKFWIPANDALAFPVKSGKATLKFRSTDPRWTVPASATCTVENDNTVLGVDVAATRVSVVGFDVEFEQPGASGSVAMAPKNGQVLPGKPVSLTAKPGKDTVFAYWLVNGEKVGYASTLKYAPDGCPCRSRIPPTRRSSR